MIELDIIQTALTLTTGHYHAYSHSYLLEDTDSILNIHDVLNVIYIMYIDLETWEMLQGHSLCPY